MWPEALQAGSEVAGGDPGVEHTPEPTQTLTPELSHGRAVVYLESLIGTGAVTEVWRAHSASGRLLAVKRFNEVERQAKAHWLLEREALLLSRFAHPAIVGTHGVLAAGRIAEANGDLSEHPALALEYLSGGDLVVLAGAQAAHWARAAQRVLAAVAHLHEAGYVHGDVKARNVMFDARNQAKLIDLSSCLPIGAVCSAPIGTPSQQRVRSAGHTVSEDDDVFASAALVFELIAGCPPFADESARASLQPRSLPQRSDLREGPVAELLDIVCGMLRSTQALGAAELDRLATAIAATEQIGAVD